MFKRTVLRDPSSCFEDRSQLGFHLSIAISIAYWIGMSPSRFFPWLTGGWVLLALLGCSSPSSSSSKAVWRNSLGMAFVPVPVVSREQPSLSHAKSIQMAVFETSERHLALFFSESGVPRPPQKRDAPACQVNWFEARAFCDWLTQRERAAGRLRAGQRYRLPTDHEWSCAVGIGAQESPHEPAEKKSGRFTQTFPWGSQWPPAPGAGNLAGEESRTVNPGLIIDGYRDAYRGKELGFQGSRPNVHGLHDLCGSLWEWCEDSYRAGKDWRVLRGGSWMTARPETLLSSHRTHDPEGYRSDSVGFRCVLAESE
jgi:formylglycine-generating enzyme required for sulfatase activity